MGRRMKRVVKNSIKSRKVIIYTLIIIWVLLVATTIYVYGETAIVAEGRTSQYLDMQLCDHCDECEHGYEHECECEKREVLDDITQVDSISGDFKNGELCLDCLEEKLVGCECDHKIHKVEAILDIDEECRLCEEHFGQLGREECFLCIECRGCIECKNCDRCSDCVGCVEQLRCSDCFDCEECKGCENCKGCVKCVACSGCLHCNSCSTCKGCVGCEGCLECGRCLECEECLDCNSCSSCERCSDCEWCRACEDCLRCELCSSCEKCLDCGQCMECDQCLDCGQCMECDQCLGCGDCLRCEECKENITYNEDELPIIQVLEPNGANGYYLNPPQIKISHELEERLSVQYRFSNGKGEEFSGIIPVSEEYILDFSFEEGENSLYVWVDLPGRLWEEEWMFKLDSIAPGIPVINIDGIEVNGSIYSRDSVQIAFNSGDSGSGVYGYFYKLGNKEERLVVGVTGAITINEEFVGQIEVTAIDYAGNKSGISRSPSVIIDKNAPIIKVTSTERLEGWNHNSVPVRLQVEEWGVSSGLKTVKAYVDGEMILNKDFSQREKEYLFTETLYIDKEALNGVGANLRIEAEDNTGHETIISQEILIDTKDPSITFVDAFDSMLIGTNRTIEIGIEDDNLLSYYQVQTTYLPFEEEEERGVSVSQGEVSNTSQSVPIAIEKEGRYTIEVLARDVSGRETTETINLILDKTSPIIRYVEQLNGKHIPHFQWNYQPEEMISDYLDFDYNMFLNGSRYLRGTFVDEEGDSVFRVTATDEIGNVASVYADFVIDNTPPEINFYNVDNGEYYEEQLMVGIAVSGHGERIKRVTVNGENSNIENNSQMVQLRFNQVGDYVIIVEADDLAGNISLEEVTFSIVKQLGITRAGGRERVSLGEYIEKAVDRVGGILTNTALNPSETGSNKKLIIGIVLGVLLVGCSVAYGMCKKKLSNEEVKTKRLKGKKPKDSMED